MLLNPLTTRPLVLDLDGTLIRTDTFHEMLALMLFEKPWIFFLLPFWFLKGRAYTKARLVEQCDLIPQLLPYNPQLLCFAQNEFKKGRKVILATGTDQRIAENIAGHLGIFQEVIGSDGHTNMTGPRKQKALLDRFGEQGFDYAGDSRIDAHVWKSAHTALVVHPKWKVLKLAQLLKSPDQLQYFPREKGRLLALFHALRPLFWICNFLAPTWPVVISLSLLSSGLLIGGDLFALQTERKENFKKSIFAEGHLHLVTAFMLTFLFSSSALFLVSYTLPWSMLFSFIYIVLFIALDHFSRQFSQSFRWTILSIFQSFLALMTGFLTS
ncbi:MAG: hypothetical protein K2P93_03215 [Alphaproteobacteria bacterium]|nr:hypothetical protein [Alphaproteobacteria bacterium]